MILGSCRCGTGAYGSALAAAILREESNHTVLCDPEGNQFCIVEHGRSA